MDKQRDHANCSVRPSCSSSSRHWKMFSQCAGSIVGNPSSDSSSSESRSICYCNSMHLLVLARSVPSSSLPFNRYRIPAHSRLTYPEGEPYLISAISSSSSPSFPSPCSTASERKTASSNFSYVSSRLSKFSLYSQRWISWRCETMAFGRVCRSFEREQFQSLVRLFLRLGRCQTYAKAVSTFANSSLKTFEGVSPRLFEKYSPKNLFSSRRVTLTTFCSCQTSTPVTFSCEKGASTYLPSKAKMGLHSGWFALMGEYSRSSCNLTHPGNCSTVVSSRITRKFRQTTTPPFSQSFIACSCVQQQRRTEWEWGSSYPARKLRQRRKTAYFTASAPAESIPLRILLMPIPTSFSSPRKRLTRSSNSRKLAWENSFSSLVKSPSRIFTRQRLLSVFRECSRSFLKSSKEDRGLCVNFKSQMHCSIQSVTFPIANC